MINEVRVVLTKKENFAELEEHILQTIEKTLKQIEEDFFDEYHLKRRANYIKKLKEVKENDSIMRLSPSAFRTAVSEHYDIDIENTYSASNLDHLIKINETSLKTDSKTCKNLIEKQKKKALSNITVIADYPSLKKSLDGISPFEYLKEIVCDFPKFEKDVKLSIKFMPDNLDVNDKIPEILNKDEVSKLVELINFVRKTKPVPNFDVGIREYIADTDTSIEQVVRANHFVKSVANEIKSKNLTPFETVVYVHNFCTEFGYTNRGGDHRYGSRLLKNTISSGNFNCIGFSTMFKAILDEVGNKNIETSFLQGIQPYDNDKYYGIHGNVLVKIKDTKYKINGEYIDDVSLNNNREQFGTNLSCCLMPVRDLESIEDFEYYYRDKVSRENFYDEDLKPVNFEKEGIEVDELILNHIDFIEKHMSPPISISKFEDALTSIGLKSGMSENDAEEYSDELINRSLSAAINLFAASAMNCFFKTAVEIGLEPESIFLFDSDEERTEKRRITGNNNKAKIEHVIGPSF